MRESSTLVAQVGEFMIPGLLGLKECTVVKQVHHSCYPHAAAGRVGDNVPECEGLLLLSGNHPEPAGLQGCHQAPFCLEGQAQTMLMAMPYTTANVLSGGLRMIHAVSSQGGKYERSKLWPAVG